MKKGLQFKIICVNIALLILPLLITVFLFIHFILRSSQEEIEHYFINEMSSLSDSFEKSFSCLNELSVYLIGNNQIRNYLTSSNSEVVSDDTTALLKSQVWKDIAKLPVDMNYVQSIGVFPYASNTSIAIGMNRIMCMTAEEKEKTEQKNGYFLWLTDADGFYLCRLIKDIYDPDIHLGYQKIQINSKALRKEFSSSNKINISIFLTDDTGNILLSSVSDGISSDITEKVLPDYLNDMMKSSEFSDDSVFCKYMNSGKDSYLVSSAYCPSSKTHLVGIAFSPRKTIAAPLLYLIVGAMVITIISCTVMIKYMEYLIINPIKKLTALMNRIENEDYSVRFQIKKNDEISILAHQFNIMSEKLEDLYNRIYISKLRLKEAEYNELTSEVNPHFLFNSLNAIQWMIELKQYEKAHDMLYNLSDLYKITLYKTQSGLIPLPMEIKHLNSYLSIQKTRLGANLEIDIDITDDLTRNVLFVPKLILQPLAENAIEHGIIPNTSGEIMISIYIADDTLIYQIYDNGIGCDLAEIQKALTVDKNNTSQGRCIKNLNDRIRLKFGNNYGLQYGVPQDGGTMVKVLLPVLYSEVLE